MKFDKNGNLIPQKIKFDIKHDELDEDVFDKYITDECNFKIKYDKKENATFVKKEKRR